MLTLPFSAIVLFVLLSFAAGYVFGRIDWLVTRFLGVVPLDFTPAKPATNTLSAAMKDPAPAKGKIEIDAGKYVGAISTDTLQKTQQLELGKTTQTQDDISSSLSKLAQLKGK